jgi:dTMP kinase
MKTCSEYGRTKGLLVFLEGVDGCGKGTQLKMLEKRLKSDDISYLLTKEPGPKTCLGEPIRQILQYNKGKMSSTSELLLFFADRAQHYEEIIIPCLNKGMVVISDRNWPSSVAYQGAGRGLKKLEISQLIKWTTFGKRPDLVFLLDLPLGKQGNILHTRIGQRGKNITRFEKEKVSFFKKVREAYLKMAKADPKHWQIINATQSPEVINEQIYLSLKSHLWK